jgi:hypothetical protein
MSNLLDLYNSSNSATVSDARKIPGPAVNFTDIPNKFQEEFQLQKSAAEKTTFTTLAQNYFDEELKTLITPDAKLHRWRPENPYYTPGSK